MKKSIKNPNSLNPGEALVFVMMQAYLSQLNEREVVHAYSNVYLRYHSASCLFRVHVKSVSVNA